MFISHICRCSVCNCRCSSLYPPSDFLQSGGQWWNVNIIFMYPQEKKSGHVRLWDRCGQVAGYICQFISVIRSVRDILTTIWKCGGAPSCQNGMSLEPCFTKIGILNFSSICMYSTLGAVSLRRKGPESFWMGIAQKTLNFAFIHCLQFVAPQDSNVLLVNVLGKTEIGCITKGNSGRKNFVVIMFWKNI